MNTMKTSAHTLIPLPFPSDLFFLTGSNGQIAIYSSGNGPPVLILHSVNAAASAAEIRPLFAELQKNHTVYAFDLPGYGLSDREAINYTIRIMTDSTHSVSKWIQSKHPGEKVLGIATSLSCEFMARCAVEDVSIFSALTLVSPTGFRGLKSFRGERESSRYIPWLDKIIRGPGWGGFLFRKLTTPKVIRYFLERTWGSKEIDEELWQYDILTTRVHNAEFAPLSFLSAGLFSGDIHNIYEKLEIPVLVIHGTKGDFTDYRGIGIVKNKNNWSFKIIDGGALMYFEKPIEFFETFNNWLVQSVLDH